jgi:hypothetical protein
MKSSSFEPIEVIHQSSVPDACELQKEYPSTSTSTSSGRGDCKSEEEEEDEEVEGAKDIQIDVEVEVDDSANITPPAALKRDDREVYDGQRAVATETTGDQDQGQGGDQNQCQGQGGDQGQSQGGDQNQSEGQGKGGQTAVPTNAMEPLPPKPQLSKKDSLAANLIRKAKKNAHPTCIGEECQRRDEAVEKKKSERLAKDQNPPSRDHYQRQGQYGYQTGGDSGTETKSESESRITNRESMHVLVRQGNEIRVEAETPKRRGRPKKTKNAVGVKERAVRERERAVRKRERAVREREREQ